MKKFIVVAMGFCLLGQTAIASAIAPGSIRHPGLPQLSVAEFLKLSARDLEKFSGKKMNLGARISFGILKAKMRKAVKKNPAITVNAFMASQKKANPGVIVLIILLAAVLIFFLLFLVLYTDFKK